MKVYISKTSNVLNKSPYQPELITPRLCLNPMYSYVKLYFQCEILLDSGAYQDEEVRVTFQQAYDRQRAYQTKLEQVAKYIVVYDKIGDFETTMVANKFLLGLKLPAGQQKILVVQGESESEYSQCLKDILALYSHEKFVIGFGGVAKCGMNKRIERKLYSAIENNINVLRLVKHVHIFGCFTNRVLKQVESMLPTVDISVDTASCEIRSVMGNTFNEGYWVKTYDRSQKYIAYHPNVLAHDNIRRVVDYYEGETKYRYQNICDGIC